MSEIILSQNDVRCCCFSPEGVLYTAFKNTITAWKPVLSGTNTPEYTVSLPPEARPMLISQLVVNPTNPEYLLCSTYNQVHLLHLPSQTWQGSIQAPAPIVSLVFHPARPLLTLGLENGMVQVYVCPDLNLHHELQLFHSETRVVSLAYTPSGSKLAVATMDTDRSRFCAVEVHDTLFWQMDYRLSLPRHKNIAAVAFDGGHQLWVLSGQKDIACYHPRKGCKQFDLPEIGHSRCAKALKWLPEQQQMLVWAEKGTFFYSTEGEMQRMRLTAQGEVTAAEVHPSEEYSAVIKSERVLLITREHTQSRGYQHILG